MHGTVSRTMAVVAAVSLLGVGPVAAQDTRDAALALERAAAVEKALLAEAARDHAARLAAQRTAADRVARLAASGDALVRALLLADDLTPDDARAARERLDQADAELDRARRELEALAAEAIATRPALAEHALRWAALDAEAAQLRERARAAEPLDGTWEVRLLPTDDRGLFVLRQDGTLLSGRYRQASGRNGSLTGTVVDGKVQLEQVDARLGRHAVFYGVWSAADETVRGTWESRLLGTGQPAHGTWRAVRRAEGAAEDAVPSPEAPEAPEASGPGGP